MQPMVLVLSEYSVLASYPVLGQTTRPGRGRAVDSCRVFRAAPPAPAARGRTAYRTLPPC